MLQSIFNFTKEESYNDNDFIVSDYNKDTYEYVNSWPNWPSKNCCIYGVKGCGKTFIAKMLLRKSAAMELVLQDLKGVNLSELLLQNECFIFEDIDQSLQRKDIDLEVILFNMLNLAREEKKFILFTSSLPLNQLEIKIADLRSRLNAVPSFAIGQPDDQALQIFLFKQFSDYQLRINKEVIDYLLKRVGRSFNDLRVLVAKIDRVSLREKRDVTIPFVRKIIEQDGN